MANSAIVPTVAPGNRLDVSQVDQKLTLANGMTAGYGDNDGNNDNPKPAGGQYGTFPFQPNRIGFMRNVVALDGSTDGSGLFTLYFMYNPNQISVNWQTNNQQAAPLYLYSSQGAPDATNPQGANTDNAAVPALASTQSVTWSLWFDRTYDMMYGNSPGVNPEFDRGVLKDVAALYNLMGTFISSAAVPVSSPIEVVFGQNGGGQLWGFTGYLTSVGITYGIFRHDMIPSQCQVDLTMMATYVTNSVPTSAGTAGATAATSGSTSSGLLSGAASGPPVSTIPQSALLNQ